MPQLIFGGILAVIMLGLYIYSIFTAVAIAHKCGDVSECATQLSSNISLLLNLIGGLISATVVGVLGSTNRGEFPAQKSFEKHMSRTVYVKDNLNGIVLVKKKPDRNCFENRRYYAVAFYSGLDYLRSNHNRVWLSSVL